MTPPYKNLRIPFSSRQLLRQFAGKQGQANSGRFEQRRLIDSCQMREVFGRNSLIRRGARNVFV